MRFLPGLLLVTALLPPSVHGGGVLKFTALISRFDDPIPAPHACVTTPLNCSLRGAIAFVEGSGSTINPTIPLPAGTFALSSQLEITGSVELKGPGPATTAIDARGLSRVARIAPSAVVTIAGISLHGGHALQGDTNGGAILNEGTLTLVDAVVHDNNAAGGGGIYSDGPLTLTRTLITNNVGLAGGGLFIHDSLTATDSTIDHNRSINGGAGAEGGGVVIWSDGIATFTNCTISGNLGGARGGGLSVLGNVTLTNSTLSGNSANVVTTDAGGGGLFALGTVTLANTTITDNSARSGGGVEIYPGSGQLPAGQVRTSNSIVAGNHATFPNLGPDCSGALTSSGYNLIGDSTGCIVSNPFDRVGVDPMLGPLADNGGPTKTHALLDGSPAIDAGDPNGTCSSVDQRATPRPQPEGGRCDIGAFEVERPEVCDDCIDNDGDGLTDLEDPACCPEPETLTLGASRLTPGKKGTLVSLGGLFAPDAPLTSAEGLVIQLRAQGAPGFLCARIPAAALATRGKKRIFRDPKHATASAAGFELVVLKPKKGKGILLKAKGTTTVTAPGAGTLEMTVGGSDHLRCAHAAAPFRVTRKGALKFP